MPLSFQNDIRKFITRFSSTSVQAMTNLNLMSWGSVTHRYRCRKISKYDPNFCLLLSPGTTHRHETHHGHAAREEVVRISLRGPGGSQCCSSIWTSTSSGAQMEIGEKGIRKTEELHICTFLCRVHPHIMCEKHCHLVVVVIVYIQMKICVYIFNLKLDLLNVQRWG